jgi:hypothetical protein
MDIMILIPRTKYRYLACEAFFIEKIIIISLIIFCRLGNDENMLCVAKIVSNLLPLKLGNAKNL